MNNQMTAFVVENDDSGFSASVKQVSVPDLQPEEVLVKVLWSSINYKDGLAATADGKVIRNYPRIPGIDLAGLVEDSNGTKFKNENFVFANGQELGVIRDGGFAQYCAVPATWLMTVDSKDDLQKVMTAGTAGFTAAESVLAVIANVTVESGPVLVTGATGGVGSFAVALLSACGYKVVASTGRVNRADWLTELGAEQVIDRLPDSVKPLEKETWAAVVDTVGGATLASALAATKYGGVVTACGNTGGINLTTTVFPFILRGVKLIGIDSVNVDMGIKQKTWDWLLAKLPANKWEKLAGKVASFETLSDSLTEVLNGQAQGRTLVQIGNL